MSATPAVIGKTNSSPEWVDKGGKQMLLAEYPQLSGTIAVQQGIEPSIPVFPEAQRSKPSV